MSESIWQLRVRQLMTSSRRRQPSVPDTADTKHPRVHLGCLIPSLTDNTIQKNCFMSAKDFRLQKHGADRVTYNNICCDCLRKREISESTGVIAVVKHLLETFMAVKSANQS